MTGPYFIPVSHGSSELVKQMCGVCEIYQIMCVMEIQHPKSIPDSHSVPKDWRFARSGGKCKWVSQIRSKIKSIVCVWRGKRNPRNGLFLPWFVMMVSVCGRQKRVGEGQKVISRNMTELSKMHEIKIIGNKLHKIAFSIKLQTKRPLILNILGAIQWIITTFFLPILFDVCTF